MVKVNRLQDILILRSNWWRFWIAQLRHFSEQEYSPSSFLLTFTISTCKWKLSTWCLHHESWTFPATLFLVDFMIWVEDFKHIWNRKQPKQLCLMIFPEKSDPKFSDFFSANSSVGVARWSFDKATGAGSHRGSHRWEAPKVLGMCLEVFCVGGGLMWFYCRRNIEIQKMVFKYRIICIDLWYDDRCFIGQLGVVCIKQRFGTFWYE